MNRLRVWCLWTLVTLGMAAMAGAQTPSRPPDAAAERSGEQLYKAACVSCHGPDGKGQPETVLGFEPPSTFPDFTNCPVSSVEDDYIWLAIIHRGGPIRGESHIMPAFGDILSDAEIDRVVQYLHSLCAEPRWPRGNLNFPRAFNTEKAFPESEVVFTLNLTPSHPRSVEHRVDFEHRLGKRAQYEIGVPFDVQQLAGGHWDHELGDINVAYKYAFYDSVKRGTIAAAGGEVTFSSERELGEAHGQTILEAFGMFNQALPRDAFLQFHGGFERPTDRQVEPASAYWRTALGKTFKQDRWGRIWTPMVEVLGARDLTSGATPEWDLVPQMQMSLSIFQHIKLDVGVRLPMNERQTRSKTVMAYFLWDWFDGGLFELWRKQ